MPLAPMHASFGFKHQGISRERVWEGEEQIRGSRGGLASRADMRPALRHHNPLYHRAAGGAWCPVAAVDHHVILIAARSAIAIAVVTERAAAKHQRLLQDIAYRLSQPDNLLIRKALGRPERVEARLPSSVLTTPRLSLLIKVGCLLEPVRPTLVVSQSAMAISTLL